MTTDFRRSALFGLVLVCVAALLAAPSAAQAPKSTPESTPDAVAIDAVERSLRAGETALLGFPTDPKAALAHFRKAASAPDVSPSRALAQWYLGMMLREGLGSPRDPFGAYGWVSQAADSGLGLAMLSRAAMLATGEGVAEDDQAARTWYARAAESGGVGAVPALRALGAMLLAGEGGESDLVRGYAYVAIAAEAGDAMAVRLARTVEVTIPEPARMQAAVVIEAWIAEHGAPRS